MEIIKRSKRGLIAILSLYAITLPTDNLKAEEIALPGDARYILNDTDLKKASEMLGILLASTDKRLNKKFYEQLKELKQKLKDIEQAQNSEDKLKKIGEIKVAINKIIARIAPEVFERLCKEYFPRNKNMDRAALFSYLTALRGKNTKRVAFQFTPGTRLNCMSGQYMYPIMLDDIANKRMLPIIRLSQTYAFLTPDFKGRYKFTHPNKLFTVMMTEFKSSNGAFKRRPLKNLDTPNITFSLKRLEGTDKKLLREGTITAPLFFTSVDIRSTAKP